MRGETAKHLRRCFSYRLHALTSGERTCTRSHRGLARGERCPECLAST